MGKKINIINTQPNVTIVSHELNFRRTWDRKGTRVPIDEEKFNELLYDYGIFNLFKMGYLVVENATDEQLVEWGLKDNNSIYLNDAQIKAYISAKPINDFVEILPKLNFSTKENLIQMAKTIDISIDKIKAIKDCYGIDVTPAIKMRLSDL